MWPETTEFIKTFRAPGPLLVYQLALIPGALMAGILLSPLLILSRSIAQKPIRRSRFPHQKEAQRRLLALGFYFGLALTVFFLIGSWTRWSLGGRNPWLWVLFWLLEGRTRWSRIALLTYWSAVIMFVVIGWQAQFTVHGGLRLPSPSAGNVLSSGTNMNTAHGSGPNLPVSGGGGAELDKANNELYSMEALPPSARHGFARFGLNGRRKSFHAIAVLMFAPGIIVDVRPFCVGDWIACTHVTVAQPSFMHLAFSVAFALFIFAEYVRYFALWPFGAAVHIFLSEFLDEKDKGSAILSHFYLLMGCAGPLWLER